MCLWARRLHLPASRQNRYGGAAMTFDVKRRRETLRAAAVAILPEDCPAEVHDAVVADFIEEIGRQPRGMQDQLGAFVDALDKALAVRLLGGRFRGLRS